MLTATGDVDCRVTGPPLSSPNQITFPYVPPREKALAYWKNEMTGVVSIMMVTSVVCTFSNKPVAAAAPIARNS
jgi:hypothetical protein